MTTFTKEQSGRWGRNWFVLGSSPLRKKKFRWFGEMVDVGLQLEITGHLPVPPKEGDVFHVPMQSGRTLKASVVSVRYPGDPPDMFFANCLGRDYV